MLVADAGQDELGVIEAKRLAISFRSARRNRIRLRYRTDTQMGSSYACRKRSKAWREFYKVALFELDDTKLPERIAKAERFLVVRARELFQAAEDNIEEEQAVDDAMYALHPLRSTLKHHTATRETNREPEHTTGDRYLF